MLELHRYYRFGRYLYAVSSFIGFFLFLFNSPQRLAPLLKIAGLSHTTLFSRSSFKDVCDAIENIAVASNPRRHNSIIVPYTGKMGQKDGRHNEGKQNGLHTNGKLQYAMNDDTLMRWYCKCHGLERLSFHICRRGGPLCLTYCRAQPSKARFGDEKPASWQLLGSYETRTSFIQDLSRSNHTFDVVKSYLANGPKRREFVPWMDAFEDFGRPLETIVLQDTLKDSIVEKVRFFIDKKQAYLDHGHRHQYGMLWVGPPGCGKTSLVDAIAKRFGFVIYTFPLGDATLTDSAMKTLYHSMAPKAIAVFEDIDTAQIGEKGITKAAILTVLDGVGRKDQTLLKVMTCNNIKEVPRAVRRRGRIDKEYYFSLASRTQAREIFLRSNIWEGDVTKGLDLGALAEEFAQKVPEGIIPPANIAVYVKDAASPQEAIKNVHQLIAESENIVEE